MYSYTRPGVYEQPDGSAVVAFKSSETRNGMRHLRLPAEAWGIIRKHYEAVEAEPDQCA